MWADALCRDEWSCVVEQADIGAVIALRCVCSSARGASLERIDAELRVMRDYLDAMRVRLTPRAGARVLRAYLGCRLVTDPWGLRAVRDPEKIVRKIE